MSRSIDLVRFDGPDTRVCNHVLTTPETPERESTAAFASRL
jgi:hypothetical protein